MKVSSVAVACDRADRERNCWAYRARPEVSVHKPGADTTSRTRRRQSIPLIHRPTRGRAGPFRASFLVESLYQTVRRAVGTPRATDMAERSLAKAVRRILRRLAPPGGETDSHLLARFAQCGDEEAFAALLERHGPMVWRTCQRIARQAADAEDAFQATFLVLCRKAGTIRRGQALAGWLHKVAYRIAVKAVARSTFQPLDEKH